MVSYLVLWLFLLFWALCPHAQLNPFYHPFYPNVTTRSSSALLYWKRQKAREGLGTRLYIPFLSLLFYSPFLPYSFILFSFLCSLLFFPLPSLFPLPFSHHLSSPLSIFIVFSSFYSSPEFPLLNFLSSLFLSFFLNLTSFFPNLLSPIFFLLRVVLVLLGLPERLAYQEPTHLQAHKVSLVLMEVMETRDTPETEEFQDHR